MHAWRFRICMYVCTYVFCIDFEGYMHAALMEACRHTYALVM